MKKEYGIYTLCDKDPSNLFATNLSPMGINIVIESANIEIGMVFHMGFILSNQPSGKIHFKVVQIEDGVPGKIVICEFSRYRC